MERLLKFLSVFFFIAIIGFVAFICFKIFYWNDIYDSDNSRRKYDIEKFDFSNGEFDFDNLHDTSSRPFSILLLGVDTEDLSGRTDTIIVAIVDPNKKKISLLSIPRDTRVMIDGKNYYDKINHAHNYGLNTSIYTVENFLDIPIDYYMTINLDGFVSMVDALGGIEIEVEKDMKFHDRLSKSNFALSAGRQRLDGQQALNYARYRSDAEGDYGRMRRQQQVLKEIANQTSDFRNIPKLTKLLDILGENIKTDMEFKEMVKMLLKVNDINGNGIETIKMDSNPQMIGGVSYVIVSESEQERIQNELKTMMFSSETTQ